MIKDFQLVLLVGAGGGLGMAIRLGIEQWFSSTHFPIGTLFANVSGCFLIAIFASLFDHTGLRLFLTTGMCGGLTTMSTFSAGVTSLMKVSMITAVFYVTISVAGGFLAVIIGDSLGDKINNQRKVQG
ncbi:CrcB family protein [Bacillus sp. HMF5848]|uniref:fluoride efflux transporter FluC n=1 Tax=Bacillus sp. HMF5848 TaxID=2495421 RepID=UPI000F77656A|nr:CrcB family protein [Bacillus sp. HMF5848]RSK26834.1 CrcB family protein [Bacillus sp. HMF5848]